MIRRLLIALAAGCALFAQSAPAPKASALDKATLEVWLRHLFVWPAPIEVHIEDPKPGPMAGFYEVKIRGTSGPQSQEDTFYVSKDGQKVIRGTVYDIAQNPFKEDLDKIKTAGRPGFGTTGATVVIADFSDFQCPFCKEEAKMLRDNLLKTYPKEVRLYFFDYPLEPIHPWARPAAGAGRCVFRQSASAFWDYHDWIYDHQSEITAENLKSKVLEFAHGKQLDTAQLESCIDTKATDAEVQQTIDLGHSLGVNQTPTIFINGRRMAGSIPWNDLKTVIDYEIGYQKTAKNAGEDCGCDVRLATPGAPSTATKPGGIQK
ncbi:MAG: DsbA family protein [Acidobacteriota bacterium]|nr:DsbA family protein [Acidobacteriota bacterium]